MVRFALKRLLGQMGLELRRQPSGLPVDSRFTDPISYQYSAELPRNVVFDIPLCHARGGVMGFAFRDLSLHPFALAASRARQATSGEARRREIRETLFAYYERVKPTSAVDVVSLSCDEAPGLVGVGLHDWVFPWTDLTVRENAAGRRTSLEEEGLSNRSRLSIKDGFSLFGPVSDRKLELETVRLAQLVDSIKTNGFRPKGRSPLQVVALRSGGSYRWLIVQGQHRFATCAAFDIAKVPARIVRIVRREDAAFWPHVVRNTFSRTGAEKLFDRLFDGTLASCATNWPEHRSDLAA